MAQAVLCIVGWGKGRCDCGCQHCLCLCMVQKGSKWLIQGDMQRVGEADPGPALPALCPAGLAACLACAELRSHLSARGCSSEKLPLLFVTLLCSSPCCYLIFLMDMAFFLACFVCLNPAWCLQIHLLSSCRALSAQPLAFLVPWM